MFLLAAVSAGRGEASCGDWLAGHGSMPGRTAARSDGPKLPVPCHGPSCQRSRDGLPAVPPAPSRQFDDSHGWCRLFEQLAARPPLSAPLCPPRGRSLPSGFEPRIDRPPRV